MQDKLEKRVNDLKLELEEGKKILEDLDMKRTTIAQTVLRISGAIQVLEELMPQENISNS